MCGRVLVLLCRKYILLRTITVLQLLPLLPHNQHKKEPEEVSEGDIQKDLMFHKVI